MLLASGSSPSVKICILFILNRVYHYTKSFIRHFNSTTCVFFRLDNTSFSQHKFVDYLFNQFYMSMSHDWTNWHYLALIVEQCLGFPSTYLLIILTNLSTFHSDPAWTPAWLTNSHHCDISAWVFGWRQRNVLLFWFIRDRSTFWNSHQPDTPWILSGNHTSKSTNMHCICDSQRPFYTAFCHHLQ
jgi:hypothetical protein